MKTNFRKNEESPKISVQTQDTKEYTKEEFEEFKTYLESQFEDWMNWDNYGLYNGEEKYGWDIDHIIPISSGINENEVVKLNHFTNLQPPFEGALCLK